MSGEFSHYYDKDAVSASVEQGDHRALIGGMWDEVGELQIGFLQSQGLRPENTLLDIGCGSLRLGVRAVEYLAPANYWGTDLNAALLDAGYEKEIVPAGLSTRLPRSNLVVDADFTFRGVPSTLDFAMAQSVFTHLPLNHMRLCLANLARHVVSPCAFYFTMFLSADGVPVTQSQMQPKGGIVTHPHRDPYHYSVADVHHAAAGSGWTIDFVGDWDHPRNQMMVKACKGPS